MDSKKEYGDEFEILLKKYSIMPSKEKSEPMENIYDALFLLKDYLDESNSGEIWPEGIGTDRDADEDYRGYMLVFSEFTNGDMKFDNLKSEMQGNNVKISFSLDGEPFFWNFEHYSDGLSEEFVELLLDHSKVINKSHRLFDMKGEDSFEFSYIPVEVAEFFEKYNF